MSLIEISNCSIQTYTSSSNGFWVNSYVIELPQGVIVIDTQFILSEARNLKRLIESTNKAILAIFITHPHPDHFNGTAELLSISGSIPVFSTQATLDGIIKIEESKRTFWKPTYHDDYPNSTTLPNYIIQSATSISIAGLKLFIEDIGQGETTNTSLIYLPDENILFGADLAYHEAHPWLIEVHSKKWTQQLEINYYKYKKVSKILVGHGQPGTAEMLIDQMNYIQSFRELIQTHIANGIALSEAKRQSIKETIIKIYPDYQFEGLIDMNISGVLTELVQN